MNPLWQLRKAAKRIALRLRFTVIEYCDDCGVKQPLVWTSSDPLWAEVTGRKSVLTDGGGVYCPPCFDRMATAKGLLLRWWPSVMYRGQERIESQDAYMARLTEEQSHDG